jgi:hypothetical protein
MEAHVAMFCPLPEVALGRAWHVLDQRQSGFALVALQPCGFVQAEIQCEPTTTSRARLTTADQAALEQRCFRHCLAALRNGR